ncbi:VanZ family protein [Parafilimonas sp.]|uniref:VanZ family protein n=1 Tax=Parafilimonas sp. TaxID=1969739 RepID=UPI0039E6DF90
MKIKPLFFLPVIAWFIIANILFFLPGEDIPQVSFLDLIYFDKWVHIGLFSGLVFLTAWPFIKSGRCTVKLLIKISILFVLYGILVEFIQRYLNEGRSFDYTDMIADAAGCFAGSIFSKWVAKKYAEKNKPL